MQRTLFRRQSQIVTPAQRSAPVPLDAKDLQRVAGGLPRGGGWESTASAKAQGHKGSALESAQLPRGGGWY